RHRSRRPCRSSCWPRARSSGCGRAPAARSRWPSDESLVQARELLVAEVLDHDSPAPARAREPNLRAEGPPQVLLDAFDVGVRRGGDRRALDAWLADAADF